MILFLSTSGPFFLSSSSVEHNEDINECLESPCPDGYECLNMPNGFLCKNVETGEIIVFQGDYNIIKADCSINEVVDDEGYVTILGEKIYVGLNAGVIWVQTYPNVQTECKIGGYFSCAPYTCLEFWQALEGIYT